MINLRYWTAMTLQTAPESLTPLSLSFTSDITVPMKSVARTSQLLTSVSIDLSVEKGTDARYWKFPDSLLARFPVNKASQPLRNSSGQWPLQPERSARVVNGIVLPVVRTTEPHSLQLIPCTTYTGDTFTITLVPRCKPTAAGVPPYWDISMYTDLSLVIIKVLITCMDGFVVPGPAENG